MSDLDLSVVNFHYEAPIYDYHQYQGQTNNCGPTSLAILMNAFTRSTAFSGPLIADELNEWTKHFPKLLVPRISGWATFPWGLAQYLRYKNLPGSWAPFGSLNKLIDNIKRETMTMVVIGEPFRFKDAKYVGWAHIKVLYGYTPGTLYFVDPQYRKEAGSINEIGNSGVYRQSEGDFLKLWSNLFRLYIELA